MKINPACRNMKGNEFRYSKVWSVIPCSGVLITGLLCLSLMVGAQQQLPYTEEITVISPYKPSIAESFKISMNPRIETQDLVKPEMNYSIMDYLIPTSFEPQPIKPASIAGEPIEKLYRNFIRGGFGNYRTPYLEFFAGSLMSREFAFGAHLRHLSSGEMKDHPSSGQSVEGRIWDLLWMFGCAARRSRHASTIQFRVLFATIEESGSIVTEDVLLKAVCCPGDEGEPVITIMLPWED